MGKLLDADRSQNLMFPPSPEDWVPANHPVRLISMLIDRAIEQGKLPRDVAKSVDGRPQYAPSLLLKIWVYSYVLRFRSSRRVEWACNNVLPMRWLCGGLFPDHNTLSRFWHLHRAQVAEFFHATTQLALDLDMIGMVLHGVDGTKLQASGSTTHAMTREQAEALLKRTAKVIAELEAEIAKESDEPGVDARLTELLRDRKNLSEAIDAALSNWPDADRKVTLAEMDARMLKGVGMGYNAQAVVDAKAGIIVAHDVVTDANDQHQLVPMLDKVKDELGRVAELTVADGGYNTTQALGEAAAREYEVVVNRSADEKKGEKNEYHASHFMHDAQRDLVICPQGKALEFKREAHRSQQKFKVRVYQNAAACAECPVRASCSGDSRGRGRTIEISEHHQAIIANRNKRSDPEIKKKLKSRFAFGERPFAAIKDQLGFRRFRLRGRPGAALEWSFMSGVYNLQRIAAWILSNQPSYAT